MPEHLQPSLDWLEPWTPVESEAANLEAELQRELAPGHPLYGHPAQAIARRIDCDDVLFAAMSPPGRIAVVHLTWSGQPETDPRWPAVVVFANLDDWVTRGMRPDHEELGT
jgi:hypothetical protein